MWLISLLAVGIALFFWGLSRTSSLGFPGPPIIPFLGSFPYLFYQWKHQSLKWYESEVKKYGPLFHIVGILGTKRAVVVSDPEMIKHFLMTNAKNYERYPPVKRFDQLFGTGIFNSRGELWKTQRKAARPFFKTSTLGNHISAISEHTRNFVDAIEDAILESDEEEVSLDLQELFYLLTLKIICDIGFGVRGGDSGKFLAFNNSFNEAQRTVEWNIRNPIWEYRPDPEFDQNLKKLNDFVKYIVDLRNNDPLGSSEDPNLLDLFLKTHSGLHGSTIRDTILNFIIAGRDTTATLLTWTLFCLSLHPKMTARLRKEISKIPRPLTYSGIKECQYLRWVLDETLRLYPPIPVDTRRSIKEDRLPGTSHHIPGGTFLVYSAWIMGRHRNYWESPLEFRPERWKSPDVPRHKYAFVPFHAGPQTCMGMHLAYMEASIVLIELLSRFRFELDGEHDVVPRKWIVLTARNGMWLKFSPFKS